MHISGRFSNPREMVASHEIMFSVSATGTSSSFSESTNPNRHPNKQIKMMSHCLSSNVAPISLKTAKLSVSLTSWNFIV